MVPVVVVVVVGFPTRPRHVSFDERHAPLLRRQHLPAWGSPLRGHLHQCHHHCLSREHLEHHRQLYRHLVRHLVWCHFCMCSSRCGLRSNFSRCFHGVRLQYRTCLAVEIYQLRSNLSRCFHGFHFQYRTCLSVGIYKGHLLCCHSSWLQWPFCSSKC